MFDFLRNLFGTQDRLDQADEYVSQCRGVYDHYDMQAVKDSVRQFTDVKDFTVKEAVEVVNRRRAARGWELVSDEEILSSDPESESVFCLRCQIQHSSPQC